MRKLAACVLSAALASPCAATSTLTADVAVSSSAASRPGPITWRLGSRLATGPHERSSVGASSILSEGKPLEMMVWGGSGAVAGSLAGPFGTVVGAGAGALCGLLYSLVIAPRSGPRRPSSAPL